ncbi:GNAT family N-acetyltransferase, partial [Helicobacter pullorum]
GIYQNPNLKGYGKGLMEVVIKYAFETLKVKNLYACAFNENQKAISLYLKFGFIVTKKDTKMSYFKCSQRVDCVD